jgi:hypothetical protein
MEELKEAKDGKETGSAVIFPGVCGGWASQDDALGAVEEVEGKTKVLFKFNGKVMKAAGDKLHIFARQFATVDEITEPTDDAKYTVVTLGNYTGELYKKVSEWTDAVKKAGEAAGEAAAAVAEAKDGEGEEKKEEEKPEGMGEE